jgi:hypothetical protein
MKSYLPARRLAAMFEKIDALPAAEGHSAILHGDRELSGGQGGPKMRRHVVGPFVVVRVERRIFGCDL